MQRFRDFLIVFVFTVACLFMIRCTAEAAWHGEPEWEEYIEYCCNEFDCMELKYVVESLIFYESSWQPDAKSSSGCVGLTQIHPASHKDILTDDTNLSNPYDQIYVGVEILNQYWSESCDVTEALNMYNGNGYGKKQTSYSRKILKRAEALERGEQ